MSAPGASVAGAAASPSAAGATAGWVSAAVGGASVSAILVFMSPGEAEVLLEAFGVAREAGRRAASSIEASSFTER
eukprot:COSAG01_NODE_17638_length_1135_cov_1.277992_2_plen_76_part_00